MKESDEISVDPFRSSLYTNGDLLGGFEPGRPGSYAETFDFRVYREYVTSGRERASHIHAVARAIHDSSISDALAEYVADRKVVGVMGGHRMSRSSAQYAGVVKLARRLSREGFLVCSGGGPGAMEASHFGAFTAALDETEMGRALERLAEVPDFPAGVGGVVAPGGTVDEAVLERLHTWQAPAFETVTARGPGGESLAVPTWHYGHEPPTPFATRIAKYFQNSVREDGLVTVARHGIVFFEGRAGTVQEIFQDATQNFYGLAGFVSPMVFVGVETWTSDYPVWPVVDALFPHSDMLFLTDSPDEAVEFVVAHPPRPVES